MTGNDLQTIVYNLMREKSTNTSLSTTMVDALMPIAYKNAVADIYPEYLWSTQRVTITHTHLVTRSSATSIVVDDYSCIGANTDICIYTSPTRFDFCRVTAKVPAATLTLESPGLVYTGHTAATLTGAVVIPVSFLITASRDILNVNWRENTTTLNDIYPMDPVSDSDMHKFGSVYSETGTPSRYSLPLPTEMKIWPVPSTDGYIEIACRNKTAYTLVAGNSSPDALDIDAHMAIAYWILAHNSLRERDQNMFKVWRDLYIQEVVRARTEIQQKRAMTQPMTFKRGGLN